MKELIPIAAIALIASGCYSARVETEDRIYEPAGAEIETEIETDEELWNDDARDLHQRPYNRQFEREADIQLDVD